MTTQKKHYSAAQLRRLLDEDLRLCHTEHERIMVRTLAGKEILEAQEREAARQRRTPTQ